MDMQYIIVVCNVLCVYVILSFFQNKFIILYVDRPHTESVWFVIEYLEDCEGGRDKAFGWLPSVPAECEGGMGEGGTYVYVPYVGTLLV